MLGNNWSQEDIDFYNISKEKQKINSEIYKNKVKEKKAQLDNTILILPCVEESAPMKKLKIKRKLNPYSHLPYKYRMYLSRATQKEIEFELSIDEFDKLMSENCTYCGNKGGTIDRINSDIGYTINNSTPCCFKCNMMKYTHTVNDFLSHVEAIHNYNI